MDLEDISNTIEWVGNVVERLGIESVSQLSPAVCSKPKKELIGPWLSDSLGTLKKVCEAYQKLRTVADPLQAELIKSQQQVISLQSELLACKNEQLQSLQSSVKTTVEESMKAEFVTYSSKLQ